MVDMLTNIQIRKGRIEDKKKARVAFKKRYAGDIKTYKTLKKRGKKFMYKTITKTPKFGKKRFKGSIFKMLAGRRRR